MLPPSFCIGEGLPCDFGGPHECCEDQDLNRVGTFTNDGTKTCERPRADIGNHCIPEGKQCNKGGPPWDRANHECCGILNCVFDEADSKSYCRA